MNNSNNNSTPFFLRNTVKSCVVLFVASLTFVLIITVFPLIGALTVDNFPIQQVVKDNFKLLIPLFMVSILVSPLLGWVSGKFSKKRVLVLLLIGILSCWVATILIISMWSKFTVWNNVGTFFLISVWGIIAYSFILLPILIPSLLIIEKWTRNGQ